VKRLRFAVAASAIAVLIVIAPAAYAAAGGGYAGLSRSTVLALLGAAAERGTSGEHLALEGKIVTISDGRGGTITAVPAVRFPTADGLGQYILFWHDTTFLGSDRLAKLPSLGEEAVSAGIVKSGTGFVTVAFAQYRPSDPMAAPSLPTEDVTYRWNGAHLIASQAVSAAAGNGLSMTLPASYDGILTRSMVDAVLSRATEDGTGMHLAVAGRIVTISDGQGSTLTAVPAVRTPTADGYGQYVLFWHGTTFLGSDRLARLPNLGEESVQIGVVSSGSNSITLRFACYRATDPMYAPSLPSVDVTYHWTGARLIASRPVPLASGNGLSMALAPAAK
jgi:hypothetical protein